VFLLICSRRRRMVLTLQYVVLKTIARARGGLPTRSLLKARGKAVLAIQPVLESQRRFEPATDKYVLEVHPWLRRGGPTPTAWKRHRPGR
jgi:hypothetical protein